MKKMTNMTLGGSAVARVDNEFGNQDLEYSFHNGLGHFMGAVETNGSLVAAYVYGPYGELLKQSGETWAHLRRFNGKEVDWLSRLNYYGYRYYDPLSLTWTQADPLFRFVPDLAYDQPRMMSLYAFSLNNPVRYMDPDGRMPWVIGACALNPSCAGPVIKVGMVAKVAIAAGASVAISETIDWISGDSVPDTPTLHSPETYGPPRPRMVDISSQPSEDPLMPPPPLKMEPHEPADTGDDDKSSTSDSSSSAGNESFAADDKGNIVPVPPGGRASSSPDGKFVQARDASGKPTGTRIDGPHKPASHPDPRAQEPHGHVPGRTNSDGTPWLPVRK